MLFIWYAPFLFVAAPTHQSVFYYSGFSVILPRNHPGLLSDNAVSSIIKPQQFAKFWYPLHSFVWYCHPKSSHGSPPLEGFWSPMQGQQQHPPCMPHLHWRVEQVAVEVPLEPVAAVHYGFTMSSWIHYVYITQDVRVTMYSSDINSWLVSQVPWTLSSIQVMLKEDFHNFLFSCISLLHQLITYDDLHKICTETQQWRQLD